MTASINRPLGTMIAYGFPRLNVEVDLAIASRIGADCLEILPDWSDYPDPIRLKVLAEHRGLKIHSAHGCWGGQSIRARRVDLGSLDRSTRNASLEDLKRCLDWLAGSGGTFLIVHPGVLSDSEESRSRRLALGESLQALAEYADEAGRVVCVENMPPGVHPGSRMTELVDLVAEIDHPSLTLALDTGHAHISNSVVHETLVAGARLQTTHVHDNNGRQDSHEPPGDGTIDWLAWVDALDLIGYEGPIMLECIRKLRRDPERIDAGFLRLLDQLTGRGDSG